MAQERILSESELILNPDGSIFHLHLKPGMLSPTIILVGDPGRVHVIKDFLTQVEHLTANREYVSTTGLYNGKRVSVVSTGVGAGNVDIVLNELDALFNIDFKTRTVRPLFQKLNIVRIGTSGGLQPFLGINSFALTQIAVSIDNLLPFYGNGMSISDHGFSKAVQEVFGGETSFIRPLAVEASKKLFNKLKSHQTHVGATLTSPGFYGPQGRAIRLMPQFVDINQRLSDFSYNGLKILNYEMEAALVFGLAKMLGHNSAAICLIVANRMTKDLNGDYRNRMLDLIAYVLHRITS